MPKEPEGQSAVLLARAALLLWPGQSCCLAVFAMAGFAGARVGHVMLRAWDTTWHLKATNAIKKSFFMIAGLKRLRSARCRNHDSS